MRGKTDDSGVAFDRPRPVTRTASSVFSDSVSSLNYYPEGQAIVCRDGKNRYTRALYGHETAFRVETSDCPVFAVYDKDTLLHVSVSLSVSGISYPLDSTAHCESRYVAGRRDYILTDGRWGRGRVRVSVWACQDRDGALWALSSDGFADAPTWQIDVRPTRVRRLVRNGDIGRFRHPEAFEPLKDVRPDRLRLTGNEAAVVLYRTEKGKGDFRLQQATAAETAQAEAERLKRTGTLAFSTPDAFINPLGPLLLAAADGAWDGESWLHGAVGWRSQLPGWRAGFLGDFIGKNERSRSHFIAYAKSQVTDCPAVIPPPAQDSAHGLSRGVYKWGTPMYSDGYICRSPGNNHRFHHYDMNLNFVDELLWHFQFDADTAGLRFFWPLLRRHLAWEKRTWDADGDHLYDAYCCIWASDALYYNAGAVTHSSAYNYRANRLAARIAVLLGEDGAPYQAEADSILAAMNRRLWVSDEGHWAEYQDYMGLRRVHPDAALWSIYTPIDCGACTPRQADEATRYADRHFPRVPLRVKGLEETCHTFATTTWQPYEWSIHNVATAEMLHTALAYFEAGRAESGFRLLKGALVDAMYAGTSPGNFAQISPRDAVLGESYRDFSDVTGIASRAIVQGLFGITPNALYGECILRPGLPSSWDSVRVSTPYLEYDFRREHGKDIYTVRQHFARPLRIVFRQNTGPGEWREIQGTDAPVQRFEVPAVLPFDTLAPFEDVPVEGKVYILPQSKKRQKVDLSGRYNACVEDIFRQEYLSPRPPYTTLEIPVQGIGDWCSTKKTADIRCRDSVIYTSLWDNYPDSVTVPLAGKARNVRLTLCGSTNAMQSRIANGRVRVEYADETAEILWLVNPDNWCPIERDYLNDGLSFRLSEPRPLRRHFLTGLESRTLSDDLGITDALREIPGGAATILDLPLNPRKRLRKLTLTTLSNDVVIGVMGIELWK